MTLPFPITPPLPPIVFVDDALTELSPLNDLRPSFEIRTGALTLAERLEILHGSPAIGALMPERLVALTRERNPKLALNAGLLLAKLPNEVLLVNARLAKVDRLTLEEAVLRGGATLDSHGECIAARVTREQLSQLVTTAVTRWPEVLDVLGLSPSAQIDAPAVLTRPWQVRTFRDPCLTLDLELLQQRARTRPTRTMPLDDVRFIGQSTFTLAPTAKVYPGVTFDLEHGPIFIDDHAVIRPGVTVVGPAYIGPHSHALDRAFIKSSTAIGPWCKFAGEVGGTIVQGFSNKAHDGHLGDSWLGEWVNLGAGTANSNLLNTYGEVIAKMLPSRLCPHPSNERTGETFLGCILGDHVKTAIATRIMTGSVVGTGTMFAASRPLAGTVPSMSWITDGDQPRPLVKPYRFDKFLEVATAAMARRKLVPSTAYIAALESVSTI